MWVVCDIETNRLENPDKLWFIVCRDIDTRKTYIFRPYESTTEFEEFAKNVEVWIGHFFLGFDYLQINRLTPVTIDPTTVVDTLVVARLANYAWWDDELKPRPLNHSLADWGERFGIEKKHTSISFDTPSDDLLERCVSDVDITERLFRHYESFIKDERNSAALTVEHEDQLGCNDIHRNGFFFDLHRASEIHRDIIQRQDTLTEELKKGFPPQSRLIKEIVPRATKYGTLNRSDFRWLESDDLTAYSVGAPFSRFDWKEFNPASSKDRVLELNKAGWNPTDKTDAHIDAEKAFKSDPSDANRERLERLRITGWKTSEDNLQTLPADAPEASRKLVQWLLLQGRRLKLEEWFRAYNPTTGRIHGTYMPIGSWTHRKAHSAPNQANTPSKDSKYNGPELKTLAKEFGIKLRECFYAPENRLLIGTDADGIQARIFAHYINDPDFIEALVNGSSELGTDIHTLHATRLNPICKSRPDAKTFYYAWLLGAGAAKVANIFGCSLHDAKVAIKIFLDIYPGLKYLKESVIPSDADKGYFIGFDGRIVPCPSEYLMLAGYLQNGESVIMKHAAALWRTQLRKENIWFQQVNDVHDEWQTEVEGTDADIYWHEPEPGKGLWLPKPGTLIEHIGKVQADSIRIVGERFNLNCPFKGNYKIGHNWNETH